MPDDPELPELVQSPLSQTVKRGEASVEVLIYRGSDEVAWLREVQDEAGDSTVWDDRFATDKEALEEALRSIDEDGIEGFSVPNPAHLRVVT